jgi:hypothetical protein
MIRRRLRKGSCFLVRRGSLCLKPSLTAGILARFRRICEVVGVDWASLRESLHMNDTLTQVGVDPKALKLSRHNPLRVPSRESTVLARFAGPASHTLSTSKYSSPDSSEPQPLDSSVQPRRHRSAEVNAHANTSAPLPVSSSNVLGPTPCLVPQTLSTVPLVPAPVLAPSVSLQKGTLEAKSPIPVDEDDMFALDLDEFETTATKPSSTPLPKPTHPATTISSSLNETVSSLLRPHRVRTLINGGCCPVSHSPPRFLSKQYPHLPLYYQFPWHRRQTRHFARRRPVRLRRPVRSHPP